MTEHATWTGIGRGFCRRCPTCGRGELFRGFLTIQPRCPCCGADNAANPSDDLPPYLTILIAGHLIVPSFLWVDSTFAPLCIQFATWLPLTALLTIGLLPFVKGGAVGLCWATDLFARSPCKDRTGTMSDRLATDLRRAIAADQIVPWFQPLVELRTGRLAGFEVLARWRHAVRGLVHPSAFIPVAEQSGLIGALTQRVLSGACRAATAWPDHLKLSVNLSPLQLSDRALPEQLRTLVEETGFPFRRLIFEVTDPVTDRQPCRGTQRRAGAEGAGRQPCARRLWHRLRQHGPTPRVTVRPPEDRCQPGAPHVRPARISSDRRLDRGAGPQPRHGNDCRRRGAANRGRYADQPGLRHRPGLVVQSTGSGRAGAGDIGDAACSQRAPAGAYRRGRGAPAGSGARPKP